MRSDFSISALRLLPTEKDLTHNQEVLDLFFRFLYERQLIWYKRFILKEPMPWTTDEVLLKNKFTNIYRELDAGTIVVEDAILPRFDGSEKSGQLVLFNLLFYRFVNNRHSWEKCVGFVENWADEYKAALMKRFLESGESVFTCAHMLPPLTQYAAAGPRKIARLFVLLDCIWDQIESLYQDIQSSTCMSQAFKSISSFSGYGPFLSYEVVCDLSYSRVVSWDEDHWVNCGPGCIRGLQAIYDVPKVGTEFRKVIAPDLVKRLRNTQLDHFKRLGLDFFSIAYKNQYLTMRNVEHSLCEFYKYFKTRNGTGRCKVRFNPSSIDEVTMRRLAGVSG